MNDDQLLRYSRHILLDDVGIEGQQCLVDSHVLVVGGDLGTGGAVLLSATSLDVNRALPVAFRKDDGSTLVSGFRTSTGTAQNGGNDVRQAFWLEPETAFRPKSEVLRTSINDYQNRRAQASAAAFIDSCRLAAASTSGPRLSCAAAQDGDSKSDSSASARSRSGIGEKKRMTALCARRRGHAIVGTCFCRRARSAKQALVTPILPPFVRSGRTRAAL